MGHERLEQGLVSAAHALNHIAPLFVMADPQDIHVIPQVKADHNEKPTIFFYDRYPGGIGLSEKIYSGMGTEVFTETKKMMILTVDVNLDVHHVSVQMQQPIMLSRILYDCSLCFYHHHLHR